MNAYAWDFAHWHWPQYTALTILAVNLVCTALLNGTERTGTHNFALQLLSCAFSMWMLWAGGLFA